MVADPKLEARVSNLIEKIAGDGGVASDALVALLVALEVEGPTVRVIDMLEQGLDAPNSGISDRRSQAPRPRVTTNHLSHARYSRHGLDRRR